MVYSFFLSYHNGSGDNEKTRIRKCFTEFHLPAPSSFFPGAEFRYQGIKALKRSQISQIFTCRPARLRNFEQSSLKHQHESAKRRNRELTKGPQAVNTDFKQNNNLHDRYRILADISISNCVCNIR
ncbi:hypothetical protein ACROYT_G035497 [Oculina patagonica]